MAWVETLHCHINQSPAFPAIHELLFPLPHFVELASSQVLPYWSKQFYWLVLQNRFLNSFCVHIYPQCAGLTSWMTDHFVTLSTIFCHVALSLLHPHIAVLTGSEFWCGTHILLSCYKLLCRIKFQLLLPLLINFSYEQNLNDWIFSISCTLPLLWVVPECCKSMKCLIYTNVSGHHTLLHPLHTWWSKYINSVTFLCYSAEQLDAVCAGTGSSQQPNLKLHVCNVCHKTFTKKDKLTRHNRSHTGEKPFKCDICGRCFSDSGDLSKHRRIHTGDKRFLCEFCSKGFYRHGDLVIHSRAHTGEKPYKCELCSKHFCRRGDLSSHHRTHSGEKPFKCEYCGKYFSRSGHLLLHNRTHTGYKPYICEICTKDFCSKGELVVHQRTHTGEKPYKCDVCCKYFSYPGAFSKHRRIHV